jgi:hypothetical protein
MREIVVSWPAATISWRVETISASVRWSPFSEARISAEVRSSPGSARLAATVSAMMPASSVRVAMTSAGGVCVEKNFSKSSFSRGSLASSMPMRSATTYMGRGWAKTDLRSTTSPSKVSRLSSSPSVSLVIRSRICSTRRGVRAWATSVRIRRWSAPSTVSMERPGLASPISGQSGGISPRCQAPQTSMSFTRRGSVRSCLASAWCVTAHTGTPPGSSTAASGPAARSLALSPSRSVTKGSSAMRVSSVPVVVIRACLQGRVSAYCVCLGDNPRTPGRKAGRPRRRRVKARERA